MSRVSNRLSPLTVKVAFDQFAEVVDELPKAIIKGHWLDIVNEPPEVKPGFVLPGQVMHHRFQMTLAGFDSHYATPFAY